MTFFQISEKNLTYTDSVKIDENYTEKMDAEYTRMAKTYDWFIVIFPLWKKWIKSVIPYIRGNKLLEVSFGSGYLMNNYGAKSTFEITGIDYNDKMIEITNSKLKAHKIKANLFKGTVEKLPFTDNSFDTIINTMAFTGYPDGDKAMCELKRVLKPGGRLLLVDFNYPDDRNILGYYFVKLWEKCGDIIKDIHLLLNKYDFEFKDVSVGGFGSVHLYICSKKE